MSSSAEIEVLIRAKYPILSIVSWEEKRVEENLQKVAKSLGRTLHIWTITQGMVPAIRQGDLRTSAGNLPGELEALAQIHTAPEFSVFLLKDFHPYMRDARVVRLLRDLAQRLRSRAQTVILLSPTLNLPSELEKDVTVVDFPLPDAEDIDGILTKIVPAVEGTPNVDPSLSPELRESIIRSSLGLTLDEIESVLARSLVEKKKFDPAVILSEKRQIIRKSGILEYFPVDVKLAEVGGMELLKGWLKDRSDCFTDRARAFGLPSPKGLLLLGVQGCGKSLASKSIAAHWRLPMLRLDVGRIFGSLVGQSEDNIRRVIAVSESIAPCVLWADELEKGFGGVSGSANSDGGTASRVFATFLTWMQEKTSPVFLIATANDVTHLPPEMLRKGRFDEVFFVDLPDKEERNEIWNIHLGKRGRDPKLFDVERLTKLSLGFSGAEIEQAVVGALYRAFGDGRELEQKDLEAEIEGTSPLSEMMKEDIDHLRAWAGPRTRPASIRNE